MLFFHSFGRRWMKRVLQTRTDQRCLRVVVVSGWRKKLSAKRAKKNASKFISLVASGITLGASTASSCLKAGTSGLPATHGWNGPCDGLDRAWVAVSTAPPTEHILCPGSAHSVPVRVRPEVRTTESSERKTLAEIC